jgi:energy-coupling factor transporter transmembrane protein EcfT
MKKWIKQIIFLTALMSVSSGAYAQSINGIFSEVQVIGFGSLGSNLPLLIPFAGMAFSLLALLVIFGWLRKVDQHRHETIRKYLENGKEVPEEFLVGQDKPKNWQPVSDIRKGLIWCSVGLGISLTLFILTGSSMYNFSGAGRTSAIGIIPLFIGIGYLIAAKLDPKRSNEEE